MGKRRSANLEAASAADSEAEANVEDEDSNSESEPRKRRKRSKTKRPSKAEKRNAVVATTGRKLFILDLNGVLIYRTSLTNFVIRPHSIDLLNHLSRYCDVAIWTSATRKTANRICSSLFTPETGFCRSRFVFIWCQAQCKVQEAEAPSDSSNNDSNLQGGDRLLDTRKPRFWKETSQVWAAYPQYNRVGYTYLLDDSPEKLERNPPDTSIIVDSFEVNKERGAEEERATQQNQPLPPQYSQHAESARHGTPESESWESDAVMRPGGKLWSRLTDLVNSSGSSRPIETDARVFRDSERTSSSANRRANDTSGSSILSRLGPPVVYEKSRVKHIRFS